MTAAMDVLTGRPPRLDELFGGFSSEFARTEQHRQARKYLEGLLGDAKRKNGWQLADYVLLPKGLAQSRSDRIWSECRSEPC